MKIQHYIPGFLKYLFSVFFLFILIPSISRGYLLYSYRELLPADSLNWAISSLLHGLKFDSMISSYIIALPLFLLNLSILLKFNLGSILTVFKYYFVLIFTVVVVMTVADLPFFEYYNSRLSKGILSWVDSPAQMFNALAAEDYYYAYYGIGFGAIVLLFVINSFLFKRFNNKKSFQLSLVERVVTFVIYSFLLFLGLRGNLDFSEKPLTSEKAIISNSAFVNQMTMNPVFNFFDSFRYTDISIVSDEEAIDFVRKEFKILERQECSPIFRKIETNDSAIKPNIVLILVESLSSYKVSLMKHRDLITPAIDSLAQNGLFFSNFYSSGVHTYNGIFSSLYSLPVVWNKKPLSDSYLSQLEYSGLPIELKKHGYTNSFFLTGDDKFDNMGSFLIDHGFDNVYSKDSYRQDDIRNSWGLPDYKLFDYFHNYMNNKWTPDKPLFTTLLTISSHHGYDVPCVEDFSPVSNYYLNFPYEFADWSIKRFFRKVRNEPWFDNTIFVIVGDHGQNFVPRYELPLSYVHVPMIVYSPSLIKVQTVEDMGTQLDIFPTLMGITNMSYENSTLGIDLMNESRPYAYFCSDDFLGCIDKEHYFLRNKSGREQFFELNPDSILEVGEEEYEKMQKMKHYVVNMMQCSQALMNARQTGGCE